MCGNRGEAEVLVQSTLVKVVLGWRPAALAPAGNIRETEVRSVDNVLESACFKALRRGAAAGGLRQRRRKVAGRRNAALPPPHLEEVRTLNPHTQQESSA